LSYILS